MTTALSVVAPKLSKLVALLSSDKDGEVIATVRALGRTLKQAGADFNDLAAVLTRAAPLRTESHAGAEPLAWRDIPDSDQVGWLARMRVSHLLTRWERDFASSILEQLREWSRRTLSEKQVAVLDRLVRKIAGSRR